VIQHIVLFKPRAEATRDDLEAFIAAFERACREIPGVARALVGSDAQLGVDYAGEFADQRYKYSAVLDFADRAALFTYLQHPLHVALGKLFWRTCESTVILDAEVVDAKVEKLLDRFSQLS
jgi:Stress responsive A/B Barrel Domain